MCSSPKIPQIPPPPPIQEPEPPPPPPVNPQVVTQAMAPSQGSGGLPSVGSNAYTRRGRGRSALTIPMNDRSSSVGLNISTGG
jgi:hypothetical protein